LKKDVDDDDTDNISRKIRLEHVISFSDAIFAFSITFMAISIQSILVLDDEFDILTTIKSFLQKHGFHVYAFTDPHLALEHFQINATIYFLIISDIRIPQMYGLEFIKKVMGFF
jgi:response regulator RpfG family c-di-GMP phosphodiesterase